MSSFNYQSAGLNLDLYEEGIAAIAPLAKRTHSRRVLDGFGGFASLFSLENDPKRFGKNYQNPLLVTCTDGVGTKLHVAVMMDKHDTVGIDLVAMSVNDALCTGAEPLMFLDYIVMPEDNPKLLTAIVKGIADGCLQAGCSLVGGETAIHPGDLERGHYDLAGFCVAIVERNQVITGEKNREGDVVLGLGSTGLHSNGYSLARKVVFDHAKLDIDKYVAELGTTVGAALLEPTRIYVKPVLAAMQSYPDAIHGLAHITGGGLVDNLPRILPGNCQVVLKRGSWPLPPVFPWLQRLGNIEQQEMDRVFNGGIGFVVIVAPERADAVKQHFHQAHVPAFVIGEVRTGSPEVVFA
jgi:phosphoribosylformylglycinamidine cyclo-ligase